MASLFREFPFSCYASYKCGVLPFTMVYIQSTSLGVELTYFLQPSSFAGKKSMKCRLAEWRPLDSSHVDRLLLLLQVNTSAIFSLVKQSRPIARLAYFKPMRLPAVKGG